MITKEFSINGIKVIVSSMFSGGGFEIVLDTFDPGVFSAIVNNDENLNDLLVFLAESREEVSSVLLAEASLSMWIQANGKNEDDLLDLYNSFFSSERLQIEILTYLGYCEANPISREAKTPTPNSGYIYLVRAETGEYKIGYSKDIQKRLDVFSVQPPFSYTLIHSFPTDDMLGAEKKLHAMFSDRRIRGEWFAFSDDHVSVIMSIKCFEAGNFS